MPSFDTSHIMPTAVRPPMVMTEGKGSWLKDDSGRVFLDFVQGWAVNCLGHSPEVITDALVEQSQKLINCSPAYYNEPLLDLVNTLSSLSGFDHVFMCNSGAEANEGAIKLARKWGSLNRNGAYEIITTVNGFHGRTLATMSASGKSEWDGLFEPRVPGFTKVPLNDIEAMRNAINDNTVAVMLEPIQGEAGVYPAEIEYLEQLRTLCSKQGILLIFDEVQTGVGRTGKMFAFQHTSIRPDIMSLGKGLGGGTPVAALLASKEVSCFTPGDQGGTFNGNALISAAAKAVVDTVSSEEFLANVNENSQYLTSKLCELSERFGHGEVRGKGLLLGLRVNNANSKDIAAKALDQDLLINAPYPDTLRFMPALNVTKDEIDQMIERLTNCL